MPATSDEEPVSAEENQRMRSVKECVAVILVMHGTWGSVSKGVVAGCTPKIQKLTVNKLQNTYLYIRGTCQTINLS